MKDLDKVYRIMLIAVICIVAVGIIIYINTSNGLAKTYYENGKLQFETVYNKYNNIKKETYYYRDNGKKWMYFVYKDNMVIKGICYQSDGTEVMLNNAELTNLNNGHDVYCL